MKEIFAIFCILISIILGCNENYPIYTEPAQPEKIIPKNVSFIEIKNTNKKIWIYEFNYGGHKWLWMQDQEYGKVSRYTNGGVVHDPACPRCNNITIPLDLEINSI